MQVNIQQVDIFILIVAGLLILYDIYRLLPFLVLRRNPKALGCWFESQEYTARALSSATLLGDWARQVENLGFARLGIKTERTPVEGRKFRGLSFVALDGRTYADIVLFPDQSPAGLYFYTPLREGGLVFTRNYAGGAQSSQPGTVVTNVPTGDVASAYQTHLDKLAEVEKSGYHPEVGLDQSGRIAATYAFYASTYYKETARQMLASRWTSLSIVLLFAVAAIAFLVIK